MTKKAQNLLEQYSGIFSTPEEKTSFTLNNECQSDKPIAFSVSLSVHSKRNLGSDLLCISTTESVCLLGHRQRYLNEMGIGRANSTKHRCAYVSDSLSSIRLKVQPLNGWEHDYSISSARDGKLGETAKIGACRRNREPISSSIATRDAPNRRTRRKERGMRAIDSAVNANNRPKASTLALSKQYAIRCAHKLLHSRRSHMIRERIIKQGDNATLGSVRKRTSLNCFNYHFNSV